MQPSHSNPQRAPLAVTRSTGYALTEELCCKSGMPPSTTMRGIGVLHARDMPQVDVVKPALSAATERHARRSSA